MDAFFGFLKVVAICIAGLIALFLVLLSLPRNPLRDLVFSLTKRVGATAAVATVAPVITLLVPGGGELGDLVMTVLLVMYWISLAKELRVNQSFHQNEAIPIQRAALPPSRDDI